MRVATFTATVVIGFLVAALVAPPSRSLSLIIILALTASGLYTASWIQFRILNYLHKADQGEAHEDEENEGGTITLNKFFEIIQIVTRPSMSTIRLFYPSSLTFIIILMIRLFSVDNFGGKPNLLDYGPKVSKGGKVSDTNIALEEFDFDTFAHLIQGVLAAFLSYPAVTGLLSKIASKIAIKCKAGSNDNEEDENDDQFLLLVKPSVLLLSILQLLQTCFTYYPFYSLVKRLRYAIFSRTSHLNNTTEWCLGCILGLTLGYLVTALVQRKLFNLAKIEEQRDRILDRLTINQGVTGGESNKMVYGFGKACEFERVYKYPLFLEVVDALSIANLILFSVTTLWTGLNIGLSWNYNDKNEVSAAMIAVFAFVSVVIYSVFFFVSRLKVSK